MLVFVCAFVCVVSVPISVCLLFSLVFLFPEIFWVSGVRTRDRLFRRNVPQVGQSLFSLSLSLNEFFYLTKNSNPGGYRNPD